VTQHRHTVVTSCPGIGLLRKASLACRPSFIGANADFVHQGQARDVEAVMVNGRWLMRDGTVRTMDEETIVQEADRIGRTAWQRLFAERPDLVPPAGFSTALAQHQ
jgi:hypothetical protein